MRRAYAECHWQGCVDLFVVGTLPARLVAKTPLALANPPMNDGQDVELAAIAKHCPRCNV